MIPNSLPSYGAARASPIIVKKNGRQYRYHQGHYIVDKGQVIRPSLVLDDDEYILAHTRVAARRA